MSSGPECSLPCHQKADESSSFRHSIARWGLPKWSERLCGLIEEAPPRYWRPRGSHASGLKPPGKVEKSGAPCADAIHSGLRSFAALKGHPRFGSTALRAESLKIWYSQFHFPLTESTVIKPIVPFCAESEHIFGFGANVGRGLLK